MQRCGTGTQGQDRSSELARGIPQAPREGATRSPAAHRGRLTLRPRCDDGGGVLRVRWNRHTRTGFERRTTSTQFGVNKGLSRFSPGQQRGDISRHPIESMELERWRRGWDSCLRAWTHVHRGLPEHTPRRQSTEPKARKIGGEGGIRTHVPLTRQDAFEAPPLRPLRYLSAEAGRVRRRSRNHQLYMVAITCGPQRALRAHAAPSRN